MDEVFIVDSEGHKRKAIQKACSCCGALYLTPTRFSSTSSFCSPNCASISRQKRVVVECTMCGAEIIRKESELKRSKHQLYFCSKVCKDQAQCIDSGVDVVVPSHYGSDKAYRTKCKGKFTSGCEGCGEQRRFLLMVHHIDGDRSNNDMANLEIVCGNCHIIRHLKLYKNEWMFCSKSLTPRHLLGEVQKSL